MRVSHYFWSRLHSLSGVVPIGLFLCFHIWANSAAISGPSSYNRVASVIQSLPSVGLVELLVIFLPIAYHAIYGIWVVRLARYNVGRYPFLRNWNFLLQRLSGMFLVIFIVYHVVTLHFLGGPADYAKVALEFRDPWARLVTILGVVAAAFHLANGLWLFGINWGILISPRAQRVAQWVLAVFFVALSVLGVGSAIAFVA